MTDRIKNEAERAADQTRLRDTGSGAVNPHRQAAETRIIFAGNPTPPQWPGAGEDDRTRVRRGDGGALRASGESVGVGHLLGGRYRLERELGAGAMGVVYLASDEDFKGEIFAIKVLTPEIRDRPEAIDLVREEVRKTRSCAHPNIVGVYSVNVDRGTVFILMEYLEGKPLNTLLDDEFGRGMPSQRAWPLIQDICAGLAYAHDHSVVHSDLKPSNIFITTSGRAKLLDFGIARASRGGHGRFDPGALGALTPAYASCEMLDGANPDQRDDVYCLGCVIYEMLTGRHPFAGSSALEARNAGLQPAPIASLSSTQNRSLARALAFDRGSRTESVEGLLAGLKLGAAPAAAARVFGNRRKTWVGPACIIASLLGGLVWFGWDRARVNSPEPPARSISPSEPPIDKALSEIADLVDKTSALDVDPSDQSLRQGLQQFAAAKQNSNAGKASEAVPLVAQAKQAISSALRSGNRLAHLGSSSDEVAFALSLCVRTGNPCTAADFSDETPRTVSLSPFEMDKTVVSNREFAAFAAATHYNTQPEQAGGLHAAKGQVVVFRPNESWKTLRDSVGSAGSTSASEYPVRGVDFKSASDYCSWAGKRLPTEDEWEYVARGDHHRIFAWGDAARVIEPGSGHGLLPAGDLPASGRFGTRGLGDGVLEWVSGGGTDRVVRGASWLDTNPVSRRLAGRRLLGPPIYALLDTGFRCAKSTQSWPQSAEPAYDSN